MLIESIEPLSKDRSRITLDSGENFVLYKGELRLLKLTENAELSEELYSRIMTSVLPKRAKLRAMNLLKAKPYTEYQLRKKLKDGGYPQDITDIAIEYVKSYGYIDDKQYALEFIREQTERRSRKELYLKLSQKGISKNVIEDALSDTYGTSDDNSRGFDETAVIFKNLKKKGFTGSETYEERQKILAYFYRRGFDMDAVYKAMDSFGE